MTPQVGEEKEPGCPPGKRQRRKRVVVSSESSEDNGQSQPVPAVEPASVPASGSKEARPADMNVAPSPHVAAAAEAAGPAPGTRQEGARVVGAARQFLRVRRNDAIMERGETQRFTLANKDRRKGEWNWEVLDERAAELELAAPSTEALPSGASAPPPASTSDGSIRESLEPSAGIPAESRAAPRLPSEEPAEEPVEEPAAGLAREHAGAVPRAQPTLPAPMSEMELARVAQAFVPQARQGGPRTKWVSSSKPTAALRADEPKVTNCKHERRTKPTSAGCQWICTDCGDVLWFDGWRLEYSNTGPYQIQLPQAVTMTGAEDIRAPVPGDRAATYAVRN